MSENPPMEESLPADTDPAAREREKAAALRRIFEQDPLRERDLERHEVRDRPPAPPEAEGLPPETAPPPPRIPHAGQRRERGFRHGGAHRPGAPPGPLPGGRGPDPIARERDRLRGALSSVEGRLRNLQRENDTLRRRLQALASGVAGAPPPSSPPPPVPVEPNQATPVERPIARGPTAPGVLRDQRIAILLDFQGLLASARKRGRSLAVARLLASIVRGRPLVRAIAYGAPAEGGEFAGALRNLGFESVPGERTAEQAAADARALRARVDALVAVGFDDSLAEVLRENREAGVRTEVAGFESHDSPALCAVAHAFLRLGEEAEG